MANYTVLSKPSNSSYLSPITYGSAVSSPIEGTNLQEYLNSYLSSLMDTLYPIGSHYITTSIENPAVLFNYGVWEKVAAGNTLLGANDTYPLGSTGGEATHTLTVAEMPSHYHGTTRTTHSRNGSNDGTKDYGRPSTSSGVSTGATGGGQAHNNMQPYIKVIVWKRVG